MTDQPPVTTLITDPDEQRDSPDDSPVVGYAMIDPDPTRGPLAFWSSLPRTNDQDSALILKALNAADRTVESLIGKECEVRAVFVQPVQVVDRESGEVRDLRRIVLIGPDGTTTSTCSQGIYNSLRALITLKGQGPWNPPLRVGFRQVSTRNGNRVYVMDWIVPAAAVASELEKKGGKNAK